ncbi:hypothetical protein ACN47E_006391 [Coniothyrium glycines]
MERRNSHDDEPAQQPSTTDVFDDDHEIDPDEDDFMPSVSDGFRPADASEASRNDRHHHDRFDALQRHASTPKTNETGLRRMATRNSIAKGHDAMPPERRHSLARASYSHTHAAFRDSVSSTGSFATTSHSENPFEPGTGPSHPYGMYPQHTMARPASVATTVTDQQPHRSMSLQRPTHPYAMYSQSGLADEEPLEESPRPPVPQIQTAIPLGFPGRNAAYHRVLGPDGEEQDIVGPDGHTEQLPPYSQYPEEGPTKASMAAQASASRVVSAPLQIADPEDPLMTPVSPVSPLSSISFSTPTLPTQPLLPSVTPARLPPQRPETQTGNVATTTSAYANTIPAEPSESSSASLLTTENSFSEKAEPEDAKVSWRKRKLWGKVPMGIFVIVIILLFVFAIALGTAIGTLVVKKHGGKDKDRRPPYEQPQSQITGPNGTLFGAYPISTPPGLPPLPTGAFALPLGIPQESNPGCLTQASQYSAWSCKLTFAPLVITVNSTSNGQFASMAQGGSVPNGATLYGLQTPLLDMQSMDLVIDLDYKAYGPSWHFAARYDKLVVLRSEELSAAGGFSRRQEDKGFRQRFQVRPGDNPWYCFWNHTYIEAYIYSQDNSSAASGTSFPTGWATTSPGPTSLNTGAVVAATAATAPMIPPFTSSSPTAGAAVTPPAAVRRDAQLDPAALPRIQPYPRIVKIEERRLPDSPQPYCQKMVLLDDGQIAPAPNGKDSPTRIWLQESDPSYEDFINAQPSQSGNSKRDEFQKRGDPADACHCQWMFQ